MPEKEDGDQLPEGNKLVSMVLDCTEGTNQQENALLSSSKPYVSPTDGPQLVFANIFCKIL
jgi:hypothetical protein